MDEILVEATGGSRPLILSLSSQFVVVWRAKFDLIKGARFDARSGVKIGDDFQVNTTAGVFGLPVIARIHLGASTGFVVAWISERPARVLFQRFNGLGEKVGGEIQVSATNVVTDLKLMRAPAIAFLQDGDFVVSWVAGAPTQVRAQIFRPDGSKAGNEFRVNSFEGSHFDPAITAFFDTSVNGKRRSAPTLPHAS